MILQDRIKILVELGKYIAANNDEWQEIKDRAARSNPWFAEIFIETSTKNIVTAFLEEKLLIQWADNYRKQSEIDVPKNVGVVMAGNIPLVGFHDFLCVFISGHNITIKTSSKDDVLIKHLIGKMFEWNKNLANIISFAERLNGCDAYIATGSNNSSRYFEYYFGKYPSIIRKNRTSVAILTGEESKEELSLLADDIQQYFGLGCRNVTKLYVPKKFDFIPLMDALKKYEFYADFHKYKHNFDYHLALLIMGNKLYMNNGTVIFSEDTQLFSPISQINYEYYDNKSQLIESLKANPQIQCIVGDGNIPFGKAQQPSLTDYADGIDTMEFLVALTN
jgi:hypothetical protein